MSLQVNMLRSLVFAGAVTIRGAKLQCLIRFRDTKLLHESSDAAVRHEARVNWIAYEASVLSAEGARVVIAARSTEPAPCSHAMVARSARDGKWVYSPDAALRKISASLTLDAADLGSSIKTVVAAARKPVVPETHGGALARLEAARDTLATFCPPPIALEVSIVPLREIHASMVDHVTHSSLTGLTVLFGSSSGPSSGPCTSGPSCPSGPSGSSGPLGPSAPTAPVTVNTALIPDMEALLVPIAAMKIASAMNRDGTCGLARFYADAACILHAAGLSDQISGVLNRIGPNEFDAYATSLARAREK
jgi:hypothetical protein